MLNNKVFYRVFIAPEKVIITSKLGNRQVVNEMLCQGYHILPLNNEVTRTARATELETRRYKLN